MKSQLAEIKELEAFGIARLLHGFYYISHYYPLRAMKSVNQTDIRQRLRDLEEPQFEVYYHFPFCEQICGFCHFYKQVKGHDFDIKEKQIIDSVLKETRMYNDIFGQKVEARTIQFGGGTPSVMSNPRLMEFLEELNRHLIIRPGAEIKFEIFPKEYHENELDEKLTILKDFGVTDIVVDLESGNKRTLDYINRKSSSMESYLKVVNRIISKGFKNIITALMVGLPFETLDSLEKTIDTLISIPEITVVNTFPTIWRPSDGMAFKTFKDRTGFVSADDRDLQMMFARNKLRRHSFIEGPIAFFRRGVKESRQQFDKFECVNLLGFGVGSFGYLNGNGWASQYYNYCNWEDYIRRIDAGKFPVWRMGVADQSERARRKLIFGMANVKSENLKEIEQRFGVSIDDLCGRELNALLKLGLIEIDREAKGVRFTDYGLMRLEEIQYFLSSNYVKDCCDMPVDRSEKHYKELINQHYYPTIPLVHRQLFERFASTQQKGFMQTLAFK